MDKINFVNGQEPALNATNLNKMQDNIENAIKGKILWTNRFPSDELGFEAQTVTLNDSIDNYDMMVVIFRDYYESSYHMSTGLLPIGACLLDTSRHMNSRRILTDISGNTATFGNGCEYRQYGAEHVETTPNSLVAIPEYIIGYKHLN